MVDWSPPLLNHGKMLPDLYFVCRCCFLTLLVGMFTLWLLPYGRSLTQTHSVVLCVCVASFSKLACPSWFFMVDWSKWPLNDAYCIHAGSHGCSINWHALHSRMVFAFADPLDVFEYSSWHDPLIEMSVFALCVWFVWNFVVGIQRVAHKVSSWRVEHLFGLVCFFLCVCIFFMGWKCWWCLHQGGY